MALAIDDLIKPVTEDQTLETFLSILETLGLPARSWRTGGVARTILRVVAATYAGYTRLMSEAIKAGFLETATGDWLTLLARYVFNVERREATFATGQVTVTNIGGFIGTFAAETFRVLWSSEGRAYVNSDPAGFSIVAGSPGAPSTVTIDVRAVEAGSDSSAPPGAIKALETSYAGVSVTNVDSVVGSDAQSDEELRAACRAKLAAISVRGPRGAYEYAVSVATRPDGTAVDINRHAISPSSSTGIVNVYVAAPSGPPAAADLGYVRESIEEHARPDSVTVNVYAATAVPFSRTLTVWAKRTDGVSADAIKTLVEDALVAEVAAYPIGGIPKPPSTQGYLYADFIAGVAKGAHSSIYDVDGAGSDLALAPGEVATLASVVVSVRIVEAGNLVGTA